MIAFSQDMTALIDMDDLLANVREFGGNQPDVSALIGHLRKEKPVRRVLRRIHTVMGAERPAEQIMSDLYRLRADIHFSNDGRPDCLLFAHAVRATESSDVIALLIGKAGYLPAIRYLKEVGCRVELHVGPNAERALFPAADEIVALPEGIASKAATNDIPATEAA